MRLLGVEYNGKEEWERGMVMDQGVALGGLRTVDELGRVVLPPAVRALLNVREAGAICFTITSERRVEVVNANVTPLYPFHDTDDSV